MSPISPYIAEVANNGNLITIDNWHNLGYGYVIVLYSSKGKVLKKYKLSDIYEETELRKFRRSASSLWWRCREVSSYLERRNRYYIIHDAIGNKLSLDVKSGEIKSEAGLNECME